MPTRERGSLLCLMLLSQLELCTCLSFQPLPRLEPYVCGTPIGKSEKIMVMLGGFPDTHTLWKGVIEEFGSEYTLISIPTPDYDRPRLRKKFGYSPSECTNMIDAAIKDAIGPEQQFDLLMHDWGCIWGYELAALRSDCVRKMVALDVGPVVGLNKQLEQGRFPRPGDAGTQRGSQWMMPYQLTFALCFWLGARIHPLLGHLTLMGAAALAPFFGPMNLLFNPLRQLPRPLSQIRWWMCYPYFQLWNRHVFARKPLADVPLVPAMPVLYVWGERKRCMFHTEEFVEAVRNAPESRAVSFDCSHWLMHERPAELHAEMRAFLF